MVDNDPPLDQDEEETEKKLKEFEQVRNKINNFHSSNARTELQKLYESLRSSQVG